MNPIQKAIADCRFKIPPQILKKVFNPDSVFGKATAMNYETVIRQKVVDARVLVDCNLVGGTQLDIPLRNLEPQQVPLPSGSPYSWALIYRIPMELTQNRLITSAFWIANTIAPISGTYTYASYNGSSLANAAMGVMQSQAPIPSMSTARVDIIDSNVIMISDTNQWPYDATLRCRVEYDHDMATLPAGAYPKFSKLVLLAVKAFIYNEMTIQINQAELSNGQELGQFKNIVDTYADCNEQYEEYLESTWREVAAYSDPVTCRDWFRLPIGSGV